MAERIGYKNEIAKYESMQEKRALAIKFLCDGYSIRTTSEQTGVSINQLKEWNKDPVFLRDRYVEMQMRMGEMAQEALETLKEVMSDKTAKAGDRVKAAVEVLDRSGFVVNKEVTMNINSNKGGTGSQLGAMSDDELLRVLGMLEKQANAIDVTPADESEQKIEQ
jgi:transposase